MRTVNYGNNRKRGERRMKVNDQEKQALSEAIDKMNEGLDSFIQLYNEAEEDKPFINFNQETISIIEKAKNAYGEVRELMEE